MPFKSAVQISIKYSDERPLLPTFSVIHGPPTTLTVVVNVVVQMTSGEATLRYFTLEWLYLEHSCRTILGPYLSNRANNIATVLIMHEDRHMWLTKLSDKLPAHSTR